MSSRKKSERENVRVVCRVRPFNQKEISLGTHQSVKYSGKTGIEVTCEESANSFQFDRVFGPESTQEEVFDDTATLQIADVMSGYNATIFAYGQTGTGKTHTMEGDIHDERNKGIIPRSVESLFNHVLEADENIEFTFKCSYVEIYMEKIRDLLDSNRVKINLAVREDKIKGIYIAGVTEEYVTSHTELLGIMAVGASNRATAATGMNEGSSRSHSVFTLTVYQKDLSNSSTKSGKLVLVDLAGSEMVRKTNATGTQLEEAKTINKSLSALGQVINALTDEKQTHVPYRDSKLTRILQDSLGGNSKTVLIVAISPSSYNAMETVSTLRFGMRAKSIENKVTANATRSVEELEALLIKAEKAIDTQTEHIMLLSNQVQDLLNGGTGEGIVRTMNNNMVTNDSGNNEKISIMEDNYNQLAQELEEEKSDSIRKDAEMIGLTTLLREKERLLIEASDLLLEAQKHYENQREKTDLVSREKSNALAEIENLNNQMEQNLLKNKFDIEELEVTMETLRIENKQLATEIVALGGDKVESLSKPSNSLSINQDNNRKETVLSNIDNKIVNKTTDEIIMMIDENKIQLKEIYVKYNINSEISLSIDNLFDASTNAYNMRISSMEKLNIDQHKKIKEIEAQRSKLEIDLQTRCEKLYYTQVEFDSVRGMGQEEMLEYVSNRDKEQNRSIQQRLEQLVAVHRQLLRKFAALELENSEYRKKTLLRDERIKQLEKSSRNVSTGMRNQAERHVAELTNLREQIQILRQEHQQRMESGHTTNTQRQEGPRSLRGGGSGGAPPTINTNAIRGGSSKVVSPKALTGIANSSPIIDGERPGAISIVNSNSELTRPPTVTNNSSNIFTKLFGNR